MLCLEFHLGCASPQPGQKRLGVKTRSGQTRKLAKNGHSFFFHETVEPIKNACHAGKVILVYYNNMVFVRKSLYNSPAKVTVRADRTSD